MIFVFGYIKPQKSELLVREYEQYKGIYCSLCRQLGESYGFTARLALSYDCTFYAMLLLAFRPVCPGFQTKRCVVNPLKKCVFCTSGEDEFKMASALCVLMTYYKIRDDIQDGRLRGKLRGYPLLVLASHAKNRAARDFPELDSIIAEMMEQQKTVERSSDSGIDGSAEPTAAMLMKIFELSAGPTEAPEGAQKRVLRQVGYYLGRWIYLIDAADDIEKDLKLKSFNPFVIQYHLEQDTIKINQAKEAANQVLNMTLAQLIAALNLLKFRHFGPVIENTIKKGLPSIQQELLFKKENSNVRPL
ncbi:MAG TPA: DUF5685 family protein [Caproiciproducens sp.]|nr:DUF5685 family protein [Caproiciproducens sp.]